MGAFTVTSVDAQGIYNNMRFVDATLTCSSSYATNGDTLSPASFGLKQIDVMHVTYSKSGLSAELATTGTSPKVKLYDSDNTEVVNATNLSARQVIKVRLFGS